MSGTYRIQIDCRNCSAPNWFNIPKGRTVKSFIGRLRCGYCGCFELDPHTASPA